MWEISQKEKKKSGKFHVKQSIGLLKLGKKLLNRQKTTNKLKTHTPINRTVFYLFILRVAHLKGILINN